MIATVQAKPPETKLPEVTALECLVERLRCYSTADFEQLRICQRKRIVYGTLSSGKRRNEIAPSHAAAMIVALETPVSTAVNAADYAKKTPEIEISSGKEVLFRQERDGAITCNCFYLEQQIQSSSTAFESPIEDVEQAGRFSPGRVRDRPVEVFVPEATQLINAIYAEPAPTSSVAIAEDNPTWGEPPQLEGNSVSTERPPVESRRSDLSRGTSLGSSSVAATPERPTWKQQIVQLFEQAQVILDNSGSNDSTGTRFNGQIYSINRSPEGQLSIQAKTRGEILRVEAGEIWHSTVNITDIAKFKSFAARVQSVP